YTDMMDLIMRPTSDTNTLARVKLEINLAINYIQRRHAFRFAERLMKVTYPANTLQVNITEGCAGNLRDIISAQYLVNESDNTGQNLKITNYARIQSAREDYQKRHSTVDFSLEVDSVSNALTHGSYVNLVHKYFLFRLGQNIGLYPTPAQDCYILLHHRIFLDPLSADSDTNFILDYGYDLVQAIALRRLSIYLKNDNRYLMTTEEFEDAFQTFVRLDSDVSDGNN